VVIGENGRFRKKLDERLPGTPLSDAGCERCGDRLGASYLARVNAMKRQFQRLALDDGDERGMGLS
jgi:hypothetical protein